MVNKKAKRNRRFRPSEALMRDAISAAIAAGVENPTLDIRPDGTLSVRAVNKKKVDKDDAKAKWEEALGGNCAA